MKKRILGVCVAMFTFAASAEALTVRVDPAHGAPRIVVDGKPVRARMFWGAPGHRPLPTDAAGRVVSFDFIASDDSRNRGTVHFRFGHTSGDVCLDDIRVVDLGDGSDVLPLCDFEEGQKAFDRGWTSWPIGPENTVGQMSVEPGVGRNGSKGLWIRLRAPAAGKRPDFHVYHHANLKIVRGRTYRVTFWVKSDPARPLSVAFFRPGASFVFLGGPNDCFQSQLKLTDRADVTFISFPIPTPWPKPGEKPSWEGVDRACQTVLDAHPRALLLPRLGVTPPAHWRESHPDASMVWDLPPDKRSRAEYGPVVASPDYRRDGAAQIRALVQHIEERFGEHVAGYHPCGQNTGEWFYQNTWSHPLNGYAPADRAAWRAWLAERYKTDAALRSAWRDEKATLAAAEVPSAAARRAAPAGVLHDPQTERALLDFAEFQQQMMADCVCCFARAVREGSKGKKLVVFFYGYVFEFGAVGNGPATAGHYALRRALNSPDIDVLCSPISYFDRALRESGPAMTAAESVALAGKLWLCEDDTATHLSTGVFPGHTERTSNLADTNALLVRNVAHEALRNFGTWWMDLGASGWFDDWGMWEQMVRLRALDEPLLAYPRPFRPEVAAVIDEPAMLCLTAGSGALGRPGIYEVRRPLGRMGAPYGQYLQDDVLAGRVAAKLYVFLTPWRLAPDERRTLRARTKGAMRIWCYAPGFQEPDRVNLAGMQEVSGFRLQPAAVAQGKAELTAEGRRRGLTRAFGAAKPIKPLFAAIDAAPGETLAAWSDGSAAVAIRRRGKDCDLFVGPPGLTSELLRLAAREAGVRLYTETDCNVYANGPYIALHAANDGPLNVNFGHPGAVRDLLSGQPLGRGPRLTLPIRAGESRVLSIAE